MGTSMASSKAYVRQSKAFSGPKGISYPGNVNPN